MPQHHSHQRSAVSSQPRPGWVTRSYPAILEQWTLLTPAALIAAQILYSDHEPGATVEIVHRDFHRRLGRKYDSASREAFACLESAGVLRCVFRSRGRFGRTIYRLGDPIAAYQRAGLGLHEPDPQLLLPFAIEDVTEVEDCGGGVLRLYVGSRDFNAVQEPHSDDLNAVQEPHSTFNAVLGPHSTKHDVTAGTEKSGRLQHGTERRIEQPQSVASRGVAATEAETGSGESDQLAALSQPHSDEFGTGHASRAHTFWIPSVQEQEPLTPNQYSNPNPNQCAPSKDAASALDTDRDEEFIDSLIANSRDIHAELARSTAAKVRKAVRRAEAAVGITSADRVRFMHGWVADEWGFHVSDGAIDPEQVERLVRDLEMLAARGAFNKSPGAFVVSRLKNLARLAGVELRKSAQAPRSSK